MMVIITISQYHNISYHYVLLLWNRSAFKRLDLLRSPRNHNDSRSHIFLLHGQRRLAQNCKHVVSADAHSNDILEVFVGSFWTDTHTHTEKKRNLNFKWCGWVRGWNDVRFDAWDFSFCINKISWHVSKTIPQEKRMINQNHRQYYGSLHSEKVGASSGDTSFSQIN